MNCSVISKNKYLQNLDKILLDPFGSLPKLPKGFMEFLVKLAPWLVGLSGILQVLSGLQQLLGQNVIFNMMSDFLPGLSRNYLLISGLFSLIIGLMYLVSFAPLKKRSFDGWMLMFAAFWLGLLESVVFIAMYGTSGIIGTSIGALIGLYFLYQLRPFYKKGKK